MADKTYEMVPVRDGLGSGLVELCKEDERVLVLDGDLDVATTTLLVRKEMPERFIEVGIAEANMIGMAAGLSTTGYIPFAVSFAVFMSKRATDQISISVAYPKLNVKIVGTYGGVLAGKTGATHQSHQDLAIMRSMPNMVVIVPADVVEMKSVLKAVIQYQGPVYIRVGRDPAPVLFNEDYKFVMGKAPIIRDGEDVTIIGTGFMVGQALKAAEMLSVKGIEARVVNMSTIKPIDKEAVIKAAEDTGAIVTAENHNIIGGLGSAVAEVLVENNPVPMKRIGLLDVFGETGSSEDMLVKFKLMPSDICEAVEAIIRKKNLGYPLD